MKKVFPHSSTTKRLTRKRIDLLSAVIVFVTIGIFTACALLAIDESGSTAFVSSSAIYKGNPKEEKASVMFNVYEGAENVLLILEILRNYDAKATFFIGGIWAEKNIEVLQKILAEGHELGCHGYLHKDHSKMDVEENKAEIAVCCNLIRSATGSSVTLFAPPSGAFNESTEKACQTLGMKLIMWTKDTIDWRDNDVALLVKRATKKISKGDLILMHPKTQSVKALPKIIETYLNKGINMTCVSETLA